MKQWVLILTGAFLFSVSASADLQGRWARISGDKVLVSLIQSIEGKYKVQCVSPKESEVQWRCLNGPECGYHLTIDCPAAIGGYSLSVDGFDNGRSNDVRQVIINLLR